MRLGGGVVGWVVGKCMVGVGGAEEGVVSNLEMEVDNM